MKNFISPSSSVLGGDCGAISDSEYRHFSGMLSTDDPYITMRHKNIANVFLADGHVSSAGKDLKDYYFYNVRGSSHKDDKYTMAVKKGLKYELE
jgi:prepilin-type processing-associated H-X9-DG protein